MPNNTIATIGTIVGVDDDLQNAIDTNGDPDLASATAVRVPDPIPATRGRQNKPVAVAQNLKGKISSFLKLTLSVLQPDARTLLNNSKVTFFFIKARKTLRYSETSLYTNSSQRPGKETHTSRTIKNQNAKSP